MYTKRLKCDILCTERRMHMQVLGLAEYVIRRATEQECVITNLKLQKTLYYIQGYTLRCFEEPAFDSEIQNWQYGPVVPVAYFAYSRYGAAPLEINYETKIEPILEKAKLIIDKVIDACLRISVRELVRKTHEEDPWKNTRPNEVISQNSLMKFFCASNPLNLDGLIVE